jgi:putative spermidine/putrescine transport system permease protein
MATDTVGMRTTPSSEAAMAGAARRRNAILATILLAPAILFFLFAFVVPLLDLLMQAFRPIGATGGFTLDNFSRVFLDPLGRKVLIDSIMLSAGTTVICLFLGFPLAYHAARSTPFMRSIILVLVSFPLLTSSVVRTFGWQVLLFPRGGLTTMLEAIGISDPPVLIGTHLGVMIALSEIFLPFMVLTLFAVIRTIDESIEEAAIDLGDPPFMVWWRVTLPLSRNGLIGGSLLVFSLAMSSYVTPKLIGQSRVLTLATTIFEQAIVLLRYPVAAAFAVVLLAITMVVSILATRAMQKQKEVF